MKQSGTLLRTSIAAMIAASAIFMAGCGGGGGSSSSTRSTPNSTTRAQVKSMTQLGVRSMALTGVQTAAFAASRNGIFRSGAVMNTGPVPGASNASGSTTSSMNVALPMVGAFIRNVAAVSPSSRAVRLKTRMAHRDENVADPPVIGYPAPTFYFDDYLGLWVQINDTTSSSTYLLYQDEAKTQPAGSIVTNWPTNWDAYPQVYSSTYSFTAGFLAGSHGSMSNTTNADGSGSSSYDDVYTDGSKDKGTSSWTADGAATWSSRSDGADGSWFECSGSFLTDGSGKVHESTSTGYGATYTYNVDGSGSAVITGPDPGLPAKIVWDVYGNETITYADGTTETIPAWYGYTDGVNVSTGSSGSGSTGSEPQPTPTTSAPTPPSTGTPIGL